MQWHPLRAIAGRNAQTPSGSLSAGNSNDSTFRTMISEHVLMVFCHLWESRLGAIGFGTYFGAARPQCHDGKSCGKNTGSTVAPKGTASIRKPRIRLAENVNQPTGGHE